MQYLRSATFDEIESARQLLDVIPRTMRVLREEFRAMASSEMSGEELSVPQFRTLVYLSAGGLNNGELAELQGVSVAAMSRMVDILVRRGLIDRKTGTRDRRQVQMDLTSHGRKTVERALSRMQKRLARRLEGLGARPLAALTAGLNVLDGVLK